MRIGYGYDAHRFKTGRKCILCGVEIPSEFGPDGHSDADVLVHAVIDAILGAAALGDIGELFPDNDPQYLNANSIELLRRVSKLLYDNGYYIVNVDSTVIAQAPKLFHYKNKMRDNIASAVGIPCNFVSVKATTEEHLGFTGDGLGISAHAVVLIETL